MNEKLFASSRWIWENSAPAADEYADFSQSFRYDGGKVTLRLSADSNYVLHINGKLVNFGQYPDYPFYKIYDEIDITPWCLLGENTLDIQVWYYGVTFSSTGAMPNSRSTTYSSSSVVMASAARSKS